MARFPDFGVCEKTAVLSFRADGCRNELPYENYIIDLMPRNRLFPSPREICPEHYFVMLFNSLRFCATLVTFQLKLRRT